MGTHVSNSNCTLCNSETVLIECTRYNNSEEHCSNEDCRWYCIDTGNLPEEAIFISGEGVHTKENWNLSVKEHWFDDEESA